MQISEQNESRLLELAKSTKHSVNELIELLLENYQDELDIKDAEQALPEEGGISLAELKAKYTL